MGGRKRGNIIEAGRVSALVALMLHNGVDYGWLLYAPASLTWALVAARPEALSPVNSAEASAGGDLSPATASPIQTKTRNPKSKILTGLAVFLTLLSLLPAYAEWKAVQGEAALNQGDAATALQDYAAASSVDFTEPQWPRRQGEMQRSGGDAKAAVAFYQEAVHRDPLRAAHHYRLALAYEADGDSQKSLAELRQALDLDPNSVPVLMHLGEVEERSGHHASAMERYRKVAEIQDGPIGKVTALAEMENPAYSEARYLLAKDAIDRGDKREAAKQAEAGIESADKYINGMNTTWKKVMEASGQPSEDLDRQIQSAQNVKAQLQGIRSQAEGHSP
jgi:tetratricopeptide (TPR) repeat protein